LGHACHIPNTSHNNINIQNARPRLMMFSCD
jgi:hypothetical protein